MSLLRVAEKHGLEGVVSKRRDTQYSSGVCRGWHKVKTTAWREANRSQNVVGAPNSHQQTICAGSSRPLACLTTIRPKALFQMA
jgi:ATP-dependent DNA ligase